MKSNQRTPVDFGAAPVAEGASNIDASALDANTLPEPARHAYHWAILVPLFWGVPLVAFIVGFEQPFSVLRLSGVQVAVLAALSLTPVGVALFAAYLLRQGARLAQEVRRTQDLATSLASPALLAAVESGRAGEAVVSQVDAVRLAAEAAGERLYQLHEALAADAEDLTRRAEAAVAGAVRVREALAGEQNRLEALAAALQAQAAGAEAAIARQTRLVADASDLAQTQLSEAEAALAARAADLSAAAARAGDAGRVAADDLATQALRIEGATAAVGQQLIEVERTLDDRRAGLTAVADHLRGEHDRLAVEAESDRARLADLLENTRDTATRLGVQTGRAAEGIRELLADAYDHLHDLAGAAEQRRAELDAAAEGALDRLALSVAEHRRALEGEATGATTAIAEGARAALQSADAYAESARSRLDALREAAAEADRTVDDALSRRLDEARRQIDLLSEQAFAASQQADETFEARLNGARRLVEQSATLVDDAGRLTADRIEATLAAARETLGGLQADYDAVDARLAAMPGAASARSTEVREVLERGAADLLAAANRTAEETQAIDAAFQERVRRNYEVLSRAVALMNAAPAASPEPPVANPALPPEPPSTATEAPAEPAPVLPTRAARPRRELRSEPQVEPAVQAAPRRRLKLTPAPEGVAPEAPPPPAAATDPEFETLFAEAGGPPTVAAAEALRPAVATDDGWTWKELLSSMDDAPLDDEALAERLAGEVASMGVDAAALLPRARVDEIAAVLQAGDEAAARRTVQRLAPAAIRRLSRRIGADKALAAQVDRYVRRYRSLLADAARRDPEGLMGATLLGSDAGRAFLLLDAAAAEAGA